MIRANFQGVTFFVPEQDCLKPVTDWLQSLEDSEVKRAISQIRWRESKKTDHPWFRIYALVRHPNREEVAVLLTAQEIGMVADLDEAADGLIRSYEKWIMSHEMPTTAFIGGREADILWCLEELPPSYPEILPPQERAMYEIESNIDELLYTVHLIDLPMDDFVGTMVGSNSPFFSAGLIVLDDAEIIRSCPDDFARTAEEKEQLYDRISEYPSDFLTLMRLAEHFGCTQPIITRVKAATTEFLNRNSENISGWIVEYNKRNLPEEMWDDMPEPENLIPESYSILDQAGEAYKQSLIEAVKGHESELSTMLNEFLPILPVPKLDDNWDD